MRSVNKVSLVGNVAADPEVRQTEKGTTVTTFPLATNRDFTSNGEKKRVTDFHRVVAWAKLGELCGRYLERGKRSTSRAWCSTARTSTTASAVTSRRSAPTR